MAEYSWKPDPNGPRIVGCLVTTADYGVIDDIVTQLRMWGGDPTAWRSDPLERIEDGVPQEMLHKAADEIERLRAAGERLWIHLDAHYGTGSPCPDDTQRVLRAWEEARRG